MRIIRTYPICIVLMLASGLASCSYQVVSEDEKAIRSFRVLDPCAKVEFYYRYHMGLSRDSVRLVRVGPLLEMVIDLEERTGVKSRITSHGWMGVGYDNRANLEADVNDWRKALGCQRSPE